MILVTGATGNVGGQVAAQLHAAGADVRALVRDPEKAKRVLPEGVEAVRGDLLRPETLDAALDGVDAVFLMWPVFGPQGAEEAVAALAGRVRRVVYLSSIGATGDAEDEAGDPGEGILGFHTVLERLVRKSVPEWTTIRPGGFATNTLGWADQIRAGDTVRMLYPGAARSVLHEADIAAVAVKALLTDELLGAAPEFTGNDVLTQAEQVRTIGEVLDRSLRVEGLSDGEAREQLAAMGLPAEYADGILAGHAEMEAHPVPSTSGFQDVIGRPARTFREWAADHAGDFR